MQINRFDGGINTKLAPHLLKASEGVSVKDLNPNSGVLTPFKQPKDLHTTLGKSFVWFKDKWVSTPLDNISFTEYSGTLFRSGASIGPEYSKDGINWNTLKMQVPTNPPKLSYVSNDNPNIEQVVLPIEIVSKENNNPNAFGFAQSVGISQIYSGNPQQFLPAGEYEFKCVFRHPSINIFGELTLTQDVHRLIRYRRGDSGLVVDWYDWDVTSVLFSSTYPMSRTKLYAKLIKTHEITKHYLVTTRGVSGEVGSLGFPTGRLYMNPQNVGDVYQPRGYSHFKTGDELNYILEWANAQGEVELVQTASITLSVDGAVCFGTRIQGKSGYTLTAYRNGYKCKLVFYNGWYYDNDTEGRIESSDISYLYTYYNSKIDVESPPSPANSISKLPSRNIISVRWHKPTDANIDKVRVYRYGNGLTKPSLVGTFDAGVGVAIDNISNPIDGRLLTTQNLYLLHRG